MAGLGRLRRLGGVDEVVPGFRRDDTHFAAVHQRGVGIVDDAVVRGKPICDFDNLVHEFAHGDLFQIDPVVFRHHGHLRAVLLEYQRGGRHRECLTVDRCREVDLGVGAGPEGPVLVVDGEDGGRGARADIEPAGDRQKLEVEMPIRQLRYCHIGGQTRLEEGSELLRHVDKEAQLIDDGHRKEVGFCIGGAEIAFFADQVTDVDVALDHHSVEGRDDFFEPNERLDILDLLLGSPDHRRLGFHVLFLHRDRLFRDRMTRAHRDPTLRGHFGEIIFDPLRVQIRMGLPKFGVEIRRVDFGKDVTLLHIVAIVLVPHLHIAGDSGVNRRFVPADDIAGEDDALGRRHRFRRDDGHGGDGVRDRFLAQQLGVAPAFKNPMAQVEPGEQDRRNGNIFAIK